MAEYQVSCQSGLLFSAVFPQATRSPYSGVNDSCLSVKLSRQRRPRRKRRQREIILIFLYRAPAVLKPSWIYDIAEMHLSLKLKYCSAASTRSLTSLGTIGRAISWLCVCSSEAPASSPSFANIKHT